MNSDYYLAHLASVPGVGRRTLLKVSNYLTENDLSLIDFYENITYFSNFLLSVQQQISLRETLNKYSVGGFVENLTSQQIRLITQNSNEYPKWLSFAEDRPLLLFAKGKNLNQLNLPIAMVGSRQMTSYGKLATDYLIDELLPYQAAIISGCMYGVDMTAHQAAIKAGLTTVGVLGFGFNNPFPKSFRKVFSKMIDQGATLLTEHSPDVVAKPGNFPVRNRIVAGIAQATVVIEAAPGSGSLITAQCALDYGRVVGAVPGPFNSPFSEGTKWLVNQGAKLVTNAQDIIDELGLRLATTEKHSFNKVKYEFNSEVERKIYDQLVIPQDIEGLRQKLDISSSELASHLTNMEIRSVLKRRGMMIERV